MSYEFMSLHVPLIGQILNVKFKIKKFDGNQRSIEFRFRTRQINNNKYFFLLLLMWRDV